MVCFKLKGNIFHIYEVQNFYSKINDSEYFQKQNIIIQGDTEFFTIAFIGKKVELLKDCEIEYVVELDVKIKGRIWRRNGEINSINELSCLNLKIVRKEKTISEITYNNTCFYLKKYYEDEDLRLKMVNVIDKTEINISFSCDFMNKNENKNHVFLNNDDKKILDILIKEQVLEYVYDIHHYGGMSGHVCKLLI